MADRSETAGTRELWRRLRRDKEHLERLNPLTRPDEYAAALAGVVALEARLRGSSPLVGGGHDDGVVRLDDADATGAGDGAGRPGNAPSARSASD